MIMEENKIILILGGARSGKSRHSQELAEVISEQRTYIATCPVIDDEMEKRIEIHKSDRKGKGWDTVEECLNIAQAIKYIKDGVCLVDCLTLWISNLLFEAEKKSVKLSEQDIIEHTNMLIKSAKMFKGTVILISNEVGNGIVPENALARQFRDLAGRCHQRIAREANEIILMVAGIPVQIKSDTFIS